MTVEQTPIRGLLLVKPDVFGDARGHFSETWNRQRYSEMGIDAEFVQDNQSYSSRGVLRGLHFQTRRPQGKLVWCVRGEVFDVVADIRRDSPTFGKWHGVKLTEDNHAQFYVPPGLAHGFLALSETAVFVYKCTDFYDPGHESGIRWDDPTLGIKWPMERSQITVSPKDAGLMALSELIGR